MCVFVCGNASCVWEHFLCVGTLPVCGNASCVWERFLCVGTLPVCGNALLGYLKKLGAKLCSRKI
jgi:hypothetical protein